MNPEQQWTNAIACGWYSAMGGNVDQALDWYRRADQIARSQPEWGELSCNPELSILRHCVGSADGIVTSPIPNEDLVVGCIFADSPQQSAGPTGLTKGPDTVPIEHLRNYRYDPGDAANNIHRKLPHLMVLSTGRCGTISLAKLLQQSQYLTYHQCIVNLSRAEHYEMMVRHMTGVYDDQYLEHKWVMTRAAEWIGAINQNRPAAFVGHQDLIFAPTFAQVHPKAKFIYLYRSPEKVFESFYSKRQWGGGQLQSLYYAFDPFRFWLERKKEPELLGWYVAFVEKFARAFKEVMGDRMIEISAGKLFANHPVEIDRLIEFCDLPLNAELLRIHFGEKVNEKAHKVSRDITDNDRGLFWRTYEAMR